MEERIVDGFFHVLDVASKWGTMVAVILSAVTLVRILL